VALHSWQTNGWMAIAKPFVRAAQHQFERIPGADKYGVFMHAKRPDVVHAAKHLPEIISVHSRGIWVSMHD